MSDSAVDGGLALRSCRRCPRPPAGRCRDGSLRCLAGLSHRTWIRPGEMVRGLPRSHGRGPARRSHHRTPWRPLLDTRSRGELAKYLGREELDSDFSNRISHARAVETFHLLDEDTREVFRGYAAGVNHYIRTHAGEFSAAVRPAARSRWSPTPFRFISRLKPIRISQLRPKHLRVRLKISEKPMPAGSK